VWQLPLFEQYKGFLKSDVADMSNCSSTPFGGAITAALYLKEFVEPTTDWVHFDVMAWNLRSLPGRPAGGEALGVRAVFNYLQSRFESA
jgi:leucyl aminopeptidase